MVNASSGESGTRIVEQLRNDLQVNEVSAKQMNNPPIVAHDRSAFLFTHCDLWDPDHVYALHENGYDAASILPSKGRKFNKIAEP
jgi:hypothetical protein